MAAGAILPFAALALSAVGTTVSVIGSLQQAEATKRAGDYNAAVARNDAISAKQQAQFEADQTRMKVRRIMGAQQAGYSKSGVALSGSALDVMDDATVSGELDALASEYQGKIAYNRSMDASQIGLLSSKNKTSASYGQAAAVFLGGAGGLLAHGSNLDVRPSSKPAKPLENPKMYGF